MDGAIEPDIGSDLRNLPVRARQELGSFPQPELQAYRSSFWRAFLNGKLITDHIHYGQTWSIGLKDFYNQLDQSTLHLSITPLRKGTVHTFVNQAQVERFEGVEIAVFHRIEAIPHYKVSLSPAAQR